MSSSLVMLRKLTSIFDSFCLAVLFTGLASAQSFPKAPANNAVSSTLRAVTLAEEGKCSQALPVLQKTLTHLADKQMKYHAAIRTAGKGPHFLVGTSPIQLSEGKMVSCSLSDTPEALGARATAHILRGVARRSLDSVTRTTITRTLTLQESMNSWD